MVRSRTMPLFFLNLKAENRPSYLTATCSISGDPGGLQGLTRSFAREADAREALETAGISSHRYEQMFMVVRSGYGGGFISISSEEAERMSLVATI